MRGFLFGAEAAIYGREGAGGLVYTFRAFSKLPCITFAIHCDRRLESFSRRRCHHHSLSQPSNDRGGDDGEV